MTDSDKHKIFGSTDCISEQMMFDYLDDKLPAKECHAVEKHLLDCELCSDAMEGLQMERDRNRIKVIHRKVNEITAPVKDKKIIGINYRTAFAIAAGFLLLLGGIFFFKQSNKFLQEKGIADLEEVSPAPLPVTEAPAPPNSMPLEPSTSSEPEKVITKKETPVLSNTRSESSGAPASGNNKTAEETSLDNDIIVSEAAQVQVKDLKKEEKAWDDGYTTSAPAPASVPQKNTERALPESEQKKTFSKRKSRKDEFPDNDKSAAPGVADVDQTAMMNNNAGPQTILDSVLTIADEMPQFPGGETEMFKFISENFNYTNLTKDTTITNTKILVQFVIDKNGNVINPKIINGINPECDKEALRVIHTMPQWKPGKKGGEAVPVKFSLPIQLDFK